MEYRTIRQDGQAQEEIKKSRFICHAKRVYSEEEARDFIAAIKKEHYKATHNCSAFIVGEKSEIKRTSDDGEPSGTAGVPMLGVMENHQVTNVCFVVTRYFGGIKLGAGGLIRAYAGSVSLAINFLKAEDLIEFDTEFTDLVATTIYIDKQDKEPLEQKLIEFFNGKIQIDDQGLREVEIPLTVE